MATGYHLRAKQKASTDNHPLGVWLSALASGALALFDIHDALCPAVPAVDRKIFRPGLRRDPEHPLASTGWAHKPSILHD